MYNGIWFYFFNNMYYRIALEKWSVHFKRKKKDFLVYFWNPRESRTHIGNAGIGSICSELTLGSKQTALSSGSQMLPHNMITCGDFFKFWWSPFANYTKSSGQDPGICSLLNSPGVNSMCTGVGELALEGGAHSGPHCAHLGSLNFSMSWLHPWRSPGPVSRF